MASKAIICSFRKYTPFGDIYYQPIFDFFISNLTKYKDEYDALYILDSLWNFTPEDHLRVIEAKGVIVPSDPSLRYYDAYKVVLPQVKEDLVLFMDNDSIVYKEGIIRGTFLKLEPSLNNLDTYDVVSIIDEIGTYKTSQLKKGNKLCPYFFATRKDLLMGYTDIDFGPNMPHSETLGKLTEAMLNDGVKVYEMEDDKPNILFDGTKDGEKSKDTGVYHCRNGSLSAYLLATKKYGNIDTYNEYLRDQPKSETLRLCGWYQIMGGNPSDICSDLEITKEIWDNYIDKFKTYHGLI